MYPDRTARRLTKRLTAMRLELAMRGPTLLSLGLVTLLHASYGVRGVTCQQVPCPTLAVIPFEFTGYGRVPILRAQAESVTATLNQALRADTSVCWLPARAEERPRPSGGLPPAVRYLVGGSVAARGPDTTLILWRLIEVATNQQLLVDSLSVQEPNWQRRIVRGIVEAVASR